MTLIVKNDIVGRIMKLRLLKRLLFWWDVTFTVIDNWQLRKYMKLRTYIEDLEYGN